MEATRQDTPEIIYLDTVVSTNTAIRELMDAGQELPEGSVLWAGFQGKGRGQMGNCWESEAGKNLTFSVVLYPDVIEARQQFLISQIASLSVKKTLDFYTGNIRIKWPNDIYRQDGKICGMLIENDLSGSFIRRSIIGIGINLNQETFVSDAPNPVSLRQITGKEYHRKEVLDKFLSIFYPYYLQLLQDKQAAIKDDYMKALYRAGGFYPYQDKDGLFIASIEDVEPAGHLVLKTEQGDLRRYAFKEVCFLPGASASMPLE